MTAHQHTLRTALGLVLAAGAIAPAAASAQNSTAPTNANAAARVREGAGFVSSPARPYGGDAAVRVVVRTSGGFDWGDAMIGAAGGVGLSMLGLATALGATSRRSRRWSKPADVTS